MKFKNIIIVLKLGFPLYGYHLCFFIYILTAHCV